MKSLCEKQNVEKSNAHKLNMARFYFWRGGLEPLFWVKISFGVVFHTGSSGGSNLALNTSAA